MALQIIPENRKPSFAEKLNVGVQKGLDVGSRMYEDYQSQKKLAQQMQSENQAAKQLGLDLSGFTDPKLRQKVLSEHLQGLNQSMLEQQKQSGRQDILQGKQDFLGKLKEFQNIKNQEPQFGSSGSSEQQQQQAAGGLDPSMLSDEDIARASAIDPNIGRSLMHAKDVALREKREKQRFEFEKEKASPEYKREQQLASSQAQADVKYNQELQSASKQHELKTQTLNKLEKLNQKGVTGKPYEKLLERFGLVSLTSEGRREFAADVKNLITDIRSILGGQFSQFEFQTILNAYPSPDFSKEANAAIISNLKEFQDIRNKEFEISKDIKKQNKGKIPFDFQSQVNERLDQYAQTRLPEIKKNTQRIMNEEYGVPEGRILMFDPQGEPLNVSQDDVERYIELGATLP